MGNVVTEPTLSSKRLDLNKSTNCRLWDSIPFRALLYRWDLNNLQTAVWSILQEALKHIGHWKTYV